MAFLLGTAIIAMHVLMLSQLCAAQELTTATERRLFQELQAARSMAQEQVQSLRYWASASMFNKQL